MAWTKLVCGRLESRYRYSAGIVYNNFVWCNPTQKQKEKIESLAQNILDMRLSYSDCSLADLYDPLTAPKNLIKEHVALDKAVDSSYGFKGEDDHRIQFLFELYEEKIKKSKEK